MAYRLSECKSSKVPSLGNIPPRVLRNRDAMSGPHTASAAARLHMQLDQTKDRSASHGGPDSSMCRAISVSLDLATQALKYGCGLPRYAKAIAEIRRQGEVLARKKAEGALSAGRGHACAINALDLVSPLFCPRV